jgi:hypothetical protein
MRSLRSLGLALLILCTGAAGTALASSGHWDVQLLGSGAGDTIYVQLTPTVQMDTPCTTPYHFCVGSVSVSLLVDPCPPGQTCGQFGTYHTGFTGSCIAPSYSPACLGGSHPLTLLRGVTYTIRGEMNEGWMAYDAATNQCDLPCEQSLAFTPVSFQEAQVPTQPSLRLSWDGCDPWVGDKLFFGPAHYRMVLSTSNASGDFSATDNTIRIDPFVPDAWRFDDSGCQTSALTSFSTSGTKTCPAFQGVGPLGITSFTYDPVAKTAGLRLANAFNSFTADPGVRYLLWTLDFDHQSSVIGPTVPGTSCGEADQSLEFVVASSEFLLTSGDLVHPIASSEQRCTWNGDPPVATKATSWGHLKGLYR